MSSTSQRLTNHHALVFLGARPNVPKMWVLQRALSGIGMLTTHVVHSGQHYDVNLGEAFATKFGIRIDENLKVGSGKSDAHQMSLLIEKCASTIDRQNPNSVFVMGDVNTTVAAAIVSARRGLPVIHLEAGLRSRNWDAEEVNRKIITACSSYHLCPSSLAVHNLKLEGIDDSRLHLVGNTMAESFLCHKDLRNDSQILENLHIKSDDYVLFTVHKPANLEKFDWLINLLELVSEQKKIVFPCHPHTRSLLGEAYLSRNLKDNLIILDPLPYHDLGPLLSNSYYIITDSAGIQEEATVARTPCMTIGYETARPETIQDGSNTLVGFDLELCIQLLNSTPKQFGVPDFWDDQVSQRLRNAVVKIIAEIDRTDYFERRRLRF